eukprot:scaffold5781_cov124-Isochrysis_galbana.AAC.21
MCDDPDAHARMRSRVDQPTEDRRIARRALNLRANTFLQLLAASPSPPDSDYKTKTHATRAGQAGSSTTQHPMMAWLTGARAATEI